MVKELVKNVKKFLEEKKLNFIKKFLKKEGFFK